MINRIFVLFAATVMLAGCETASIVSDADTGSGATTVSDSGGSGASAGSGSGSGGSGGGIYTPTEPADILVNIGNRVNFDFDSAALTDAAMATLDAQAAFLQSNPAVRITVEGHADERGTREYNLALGARRASAARDYLVARGVDGLRIRTISYGKERPEVIGSHEEAWARNRRAVSVIR